MPNTTLYFLNPYWHIPPMINQEGSSLREDQYHGVRPCLKSKDKHDFFATNSRFAHIGN